MIDIPLGKCQASAKRVFDLLSPGRNSPLLLRDPSKLTDAVEAGKLRRLQEMLRLERFVVKVRGVIYWKNGKVPDKLPDNHGNHFVVSVKVGDEEYILDPTSAQYSNLDNHIPAELLTPESEWLRLYKEARGQDPALVKFKDFDSMGAAEKFNPSATPAVPPVIKYEKDAFLLNNPSWFSSEEGYNRLVEYYKKIGKIDP